MEEFLTAKVWPLSAGWAPQRLERKGFVSLEYDVLSPVFGLQKPEGVSDEVIVAELEREAWRFWGLGTRRSIFL